MAEEPPETSGSTTAIHPATNNSMMHHHTHHHRQPVYHSSPSSHHYSHDDDDNHSALKEIMISNNSTATDHHDNDERPPRSVVLSTPDPLPIVFTPSEHLDHSEHPHQNSMAPRNNTIAKRLCKFPGCTKVIKSQGHCQKHGAKPKRCKVDGCDKQAQGTHGGMCKRHFKLSTQPKNSSSNEKAGPTEEDFSVYDKILPASVGHRPIQGAVPNPRSSSSVFDSEVMPLVVFLREGSKKEAGWHRNAERRARDLEPVTNLSAQLEPWERQLSLVETMLLSGGTPKANFRDLAHAWGRERGFHKALCLAVCARRGTVERKKRSDRGKSRSNESGERSEQSQHHDVGAANENRPRKRFRHDSSRKEENDHIVDDLALAEHAAMI